MAYVTEVVLTICFLFYFVTGQVPTCDTYTNFCINGVCELQPNNLMGCTCQPGFILDPSNPLECLAIPPCNFLQGTPDQQCLNGRCLQTGSGVFACACYPGYQSNLANPNICDNVDECRSPLTGCAPSSCTDLIGDYFCTACMRGFTLDYRGKCQRIISQALPNSGPAMPRPVGQEAPGNMSPWVLPWVMDGAFFRRR